MKLLLEICSLLTIWSAATLLMLAPDCCCFRKTNQDNIPPIYWPRIRSWNISDTGYFLILWICMGSQIYPYRFVSGSQFYQKSFVFLASILVSIGDQPPGPRPNKKPIFALKQKRCGTSVRSFWRLNRAEISAMCRKTKDQVFEKMETFPWLSDSQLDMDLDISNLWFQVISSHKRGGSSQGLSEPKLDQTIPRTCQSSGG